MSDLGIIRCKQCGFPTEATALLADARTTIDGLTALIGQQTGKITMLERGKVSALHISKNHSAALDVLRHWAAVCAPKAREIDSPERLAKVIARLNGGRTPDELKECADGYAKRPYVTKRGRQPTGRIEDRRVDVDLVYRDDAHVAQGLALARAKPSPSEPDVGDWESIDWRKVKRANHRKIIAALTATSGKPYHDEVSRSSHTDCPQCGESLTIFDPTAQVDSLLLCQNCNLDERKFFRALREDTATVKELAA